MLAVSTVVDHPWNRRVSIAAALAFVVIEAAAGQIEATSYLELLLIVALILLAGIATSALGEEVSRQNEALAASEAARLKEEALRRLDDALAGSARRSPLRTELERVRRRGGALSVLVLVPDRVAVNPVADRQRIGDVIAELGRGADAPYVGGDGSLTIVLPDATSGQARMAAERLRLGIAQRSDDHRTALTVSIGVASFPMDGADADELLEAATEASGRARVLGGNRTVLSSVAPGEPEQWAGRGVTDPG